MKTNVEVIVGGLLLLYLFKRTHAANINVAADQNPYAFSSQTIGPQFPGAYDPNGWNALNGTPSYFLGTVPAQSPLSAYFAANNQALVGAGQGAPVGMF